MSAKPEYISISMLYHHTKDFVTQCNEGARLALLHDGQPVAAIVSLEDLRRLEQMAAKVEGGVTLAKIDETT